jgi:hypothetical protein
MIESGWYILPLLIIRINTKSYSIITQLLLFSKKINLTYFIIYEDRKEVNIMEIPCVEDYMDSTCIASSGSVMNFF